MMRLCSALLAALLMFAVPSLGQKETPPEGGKPKDFSLPRPTTFTLDNGVRVTLVRYGTLPKVSVDAAVRTGHIDEALGETWLADLTGNLMKEGTAGRTAEQLALDAANIGGTVDVSIGDDQSSVSGSALSEKGPELVALVADVLRHPRFPESEFARVQNDLVRNLNVAEVDPQTITRAQFRKALYGSHPYGRTLPTERALKGFTLDQVRKFYQDNFGAARTHVYVAGVFDEGAVKDALTKAFAGWQQGSPPREAIPHPTAERVVYMINRPGAAQSTLYIGLPVADPSQPDWIPLQVTNALLGGAFASRITSNIREQKGYTYSPYSMLDVHYRAASWLEVADVSTAVTGPAVKEILGEIKRLQDTPPPDDELQGIKNYLAGFFVIRNSSPGGIANLLKFADLHGLPDTYLQTYVQRVMAVTPGQVQEMAKKYIKPEQMTIAVAGDLAKITGQMSGYGTINTVKGEK